MYRNIIRPENKDDLQIQLPEEYLNKNVEVIAFELSEEKPANHDDVSDFSDAMESFNRINVDMSNFKFNRDEAKER